MSTIAAMTICSTTAYAAGPDLPQIIESLPGATRDAGQNIKHELDTREFEQKRQDARTEYEKYQEHREDQGTGGKSTVIQGAP